MRDRLFIGTSGWNYPHWKDAFYPPALSQQAWLTYYTQYFRTVEINTTFYHLPDRRVFAGWRETVPEEFVFSVKASRYITHMKKLREPEESTRRFLERVSGLEDRTGPLLFQFPPFWNANPGRLEEFLAFLRDQDILPGVRIVVEFRNRTWLCEKILHLLRGYHVALCLSDWPECAVEGPIIGDFVYLRRHGPGRLYASPYDEEALRRDARFIEDWLANDKTVYVYFNNDACGWAAQNALQLRLLVEGERSSPVRSDL